VPLTDQERLEMKQSERLVRVETELNSMKQDLVEIKTSIVFHGHQGRHHARCHAPGQGYPSGYLGTIYVRRLLGRGCVHYVLREVYCPLGALMSKVPTYGGRWPVYASWWDGAKIRPQQAKAVTATVKRLMANKSRYQAIEAKAGVPWMLIAALHERESGARFDRQLAQGDPLHQRSHNVPISGPSTRSRPAPCGRSTTITSTSVIDWRIEKMLYGTEGWNGWGYAWYHPRTPSPYVVGGTTAQKPGKYIADHVWSSSAWDQADRRHGDTHRVRQAGPQHSLST